MYEALSLVLQEVRRSKLCLGGRRLGLSNSLETFSFIVRLTIDPETSGLGTCRVFGSDESLSTGSMPISLDKDWRRLLHCSIQATQSVPNPSDRGPVLGNAAHQLRLRCEIPRVPIERAMHLSLSVVRAATLNDRLTVPANSSFSYVSEYHGV